MLNSPLFVHAYDIKEICSPLFSNSPVIYFEYAKFTSDGELSVFSTYPEFANLVIENKLAFTKTQFMNLGRYSLLNSSYIPSSFNFNKYEMITNMAKFNFNIDHFFCITNKDNVNYELFVFACDAKNNCAIDYYLNNIEFLDNFIIYFKEKARKLLSCPKNPTKLLYFDDIKLVIPKQQKIFPTPKLKIDKFTNLMLDNNKINLAKRELQHLYYLNQGFTAKEIAKTLNISNRTAETIIQKLKIKFTCSSKSELINLFNKLNISKYININYFD